MPTIERRGPTETRSQTGTDTMLARAYRSGGCTRDAAKELIRRRRAADLPVDALAAAYAADTAKLRAYVTDVLRADALATRSRPAAYVPRPRLMARQQRRATPPRYRR